MKFVSRSELGWGASAASDQPSAEGVKVHYLGSDVNPNTLADHQKCVDLWRTIRDSHLADKAEDYVDVAYNFAACQHGWLLEGRGLGKRTGANGNGTLNRAHYAIVALIGNKGVTEPTAELLGALRDGIDHMQSNGAGGEILGHRDGYATSCPGGPLYAWVQAGAPRPGQDTGAPAPAPVTPLPAPSAPRFPGRLMVALSPLMRGDDIRDWQRQMRHRGWSIDVDGWYGPASAKVARQFQEDSTAHGWPLEADGIVGAMTWDASFRRPIS